MSGSSGTWKAESFPVDDPLQAYRKKPIISGAGSNTTYVGPVVIELWSDGGVSDDAKLIAITADAVDGKHAKLLERRPEPSLRRHAAPTGSETTA
jgi:hypothetical protein